jgi:hypothetical protein
MELQQIKIFLLVLSCIFTLKYVLMFLFNFKQTEPKPIVIDKVSLVFLYVALSYIITFFIS